MQTVTARRLLRSSVLALGVLSLTACSMFSSKNERYEPHPLTEYAAGISANVAWTASVGSGGGYGFAPTLLGDSVYVATPSGSVSKVNLATGAIQWKATTDSKLSAGAGSDGRITAVAAADGTITAFNDQGVQVWQAKATSEVNVPPVVGEGMVIVRSSDYRIQAFDAASGEPRWNIQRPGPSLALKTSMQMRIVDGLLISGLPSGKLIAIAVANGHVQWEGTVSVSQGATDLERISDVVGAPQIAGPLLCGVSYQGRIVCFDVSQGGLPIWEQRFSSNTGMTTDSQYVYAANQRDTVYAYGLTDGHEAWKQDALSNRRLSSPAVVPQAVAFGDLDGYVHFLSRTDGRLLGRVNVGGGAILSPLVATPRGVLVQTGGGNLLLVGVN
ncbi:outer membrane protein assembly factor BamB [Alcaligenaceae bacterium]|nr:outer membrane protein assembly factor BamB [Alcaligenaceae bacterium]